MMRSVHTKCDLLLSLLIMVTAPALSLLSSLRTQPRPRSDWRQVVCPLYRPQPARLYLLTRLVSDLPQPAWPLLVQLCLISSSELPRLLSTQMGAFVPSPGPDRPGRCGSEAQCAGPCLGPADSTWPVLAVLGSLLPLITDLSSTSLTQVLAPFLTKLSPTAWDCLQATNIWNIRRPVWVAAIVNILQPFLAPAVSDLLQAVEEGKTWTKSHISLAKTVLLENMAELLGRRQPPVSSEQLTILEIFL